MRCLLSILLLVFLPFQFSWAAMGTYCEHESGTRAAHFGHHEHQHQGQQQQPVDDAGKPVDASKAKASAVFDVADCHFHCQCLADVAAPVPMPKVGTGSRVTDTAEADVLAPAPSRPERPQWAAHA